MSNEKLYDSICKTAYNSVYWSRKNRDYVGNVEKYGPMIKDRIFSQLYNEKDVVGSFAMEKAIGRRLKVEELIPTKLSCLYFLFGKPLLTGSAEERETLLQFQALITKGTRYEGSAARWEGTEQPLPITLLFFDNGILKEEKL